MVFVHRAAAQLVPLVSVAAERAQRARERTGERGPLVRREREAVAVSRMLVDVADGVGEPADGAHDGDRAVAQRDELTQTARLEARRHEEQVATGIDPLRQGGVEPEREEEPRGIALAQLPPA